MLYVRAADRLERVEAKTVRRLNHNIFVRPPRGVLHTVLVSWAQHKYQRRCCRYRQRRRTVQPYAKGRARERARARTNETTVAPRQEGDNVGPTRTNTRQGYIVVTTSHLNVPMILNCIAPKRTVLPPTTNVTETAPAPGKCLPSCRALLRRRTFVAPSAAPTQ